MNNTRFATVIHILTLLADFPDSWLSSDFIAGSININPVIVRKEISMLIDAGLVISKKGKDGGSMLGKSANSIYLDDIYLLVNNVDVLGKKNQHPNPQCPIGQQINKNLDLLVNQTNNLVTEFLNHQTLQGFLNQFK